MIPLYCQVCREQIDEKRAMRPKTKTCGSKCSRVLGNAKRQEKAGKECRLCGHVYGKQKEHGPVPSPHNAIAAKVGG